LHVWAIQPAHYTNFLLIAAFVTF